LIEEKSARQVLQSIANLAAMYVYADRTGMVVSQEDSLSALPVRLDEDIQTESPSYKKVKAYFSVCDEDSIRSYGLSEYKYDAAIYATTNTTRVPPILEAIANRILAKYKNGVDFVDTEWKGDIRLGLSDEFVAHSLHEEPARAKEYECLSNELSLDSGGFRQVTKGRCKSRTPVGVQCNCQAGTQCNCPVKITPDNAFSYNIPVKSRTIVNKVNVEYYVLVPDGGGETVTVNYKDCEVTEFSISNPRPNGTPLNHTHSVVTTIQLEKVYEKIDNIYINRINMGEIVGIDEARFAKVISATASSLKISLSSRTRSFKEIEILIN